MKLALSVVWIGTLILTISSGLSAKDNKVSKDDIEVSCVPEKKNYSLGGPVGVILTIQNNSADDIICDFSYPAVLPLQFTSNIEGVVPRKKEETNMIISRKMAPTQIKAGDSYKTTVYLNKYMTFTKAGTFYISYTFVSHMGKLGEDGRGTGSATIITAVGFLRIILKGVSEDALEQELKQVSKGLASEDKQEFIETVEAMRFLNTPLCLKHLQKILSMKSWKDIPCHAPVGNAHMRVIRALGEFSGPYKAKKQVLSMLEPFINGKDQWLAEAAQKSRDKLSKTMIHRKLVILVIIVAVVGLGLVIYMLIRRRK